MSGKKRRKPKNYIYLIEAGGFHKIGISDNPEARLLTLQAGLPFDATLLKKYKCGENSRAMEAAAHVALRKYQSRGEWFTLPPSVLSDIMEGEGFSSYLDEDEDEELYKELLYKQIASMGKELSWVGAFEKISNFVDLIPVYHLKNHGEVVLFLDWLSSNSETISKTFRAWLDRKEPENE